jgi:hypothetical protein
MNVSDACECLHLSPPISRARLLTWLSTISAPAENQHHNDVNRAANADSYRTLFSRRFAMKSVAIAVAAASALFLPLAASSQTDPALTRAQVRAELQQIEQAGYNPAQAEDAKYPSDIQAAEARISTDGPTAYGGTSSGSSTSGSRAVVRPASADDTKQLYFGGQ